MSKATDSWPPEGREILARLEKEAEQRKTRNEQNSDAAYLREAIDHAGEIMAAAFNHIEDKLGVGSAEAHPALIAGFMNAAATVMAASIIARSIEWAGSDR